MRLKQWLWDHFIEAIVLLVGLGFWVGSVPASVNYVDSQIASVKQEAKEKREEDLRVLNEVRLDIKKILQRLPRGKHEREE